MSHAVVLGTSFLEDTIQPITALIKMWHVGPITAPDVI